MELSKYIKEILLSKDNIIIPDFGAFEKTIISASIDENTGEMTPPHTNVIFRTELKTDSGVLIKYIAEKEKLEESVIAEEIKKQVTIWQENINSGKNAIIPGIGIIHKDSSGATTFKSDVKPSDFPDSYGLPVITLKEKSATVQKTQPISKDRKKPVKKTPVEKKTPVKKQPIKKEPKQKKPPKEKKGDGKPNKKLIVGLALGVPVVALIVLGALNFDFVKQKFNDTSNYVSNFFSGENEKDTTTAQEDIVNIDSLNLRDSTSAETEAILENYTIINSETNAKVEPKIEEFNSAKKIHIIGGSFKQKKYAQRHRNKLTRKGFKATVLPINRGLYRVSVASFDDPESAAKGLERIKSMDESLSFWILVD